MGIPSPREVVQAVRHRIRGSPPTGVAICDLNGPFVVGDATYAVTRYLCAEGYFHGNLRPYIETIFEECERGRRPYREFIRNLTDTYQMETVRKRKKEVDAKIKAALRGGVVVVHPYARDLLGKLKGEGFYVVMLTSSPEEIATPLNHELFDGGFDDLVVCGHGTDENECYTTLDNPITSEEAKERRFQEYRQQHEQQLPWSRILGVGDRSNDWGIFRNSHRRLVLNPDKEAYNRAMLEIEQERNAGKPQTWFVYPCADILSAVINNSWTNGDEPVPVAEGSGTAAPPSDK